MGGCPSFKMLHLSLQSVDGCLYLEKVAYHQPCYNVGIVKTMDIMMPNSQLQCILFIAFRSIRLRYETSDDQH